jgi:hypothetical protein
MRHVRTLYTALLAACVLGAVTSANAYASEFKAPEFGRCIKTAKGFTGAGFSDAGCTSVVASDAKYEWQPGPGPKPGFTTTARYKPGPVTKKCIVAKHYEERVGYWAGKAKEAEEAAAVAAPPLKERLEEEARKDREKQKEYEEKANKKYAETGLPNPRVECPILIEDEAEGAEPVVLETESGTRVECEGLSGSGKYTGLKTVGEVSTTFTGCEVGETGIKCTSPGAVEGEIKPAALKGELGVIKTEGKAVNNEIGIDLAPESGSTAAQFKCAFASITVTGSIIHEVVTNRMLASESEKFLQKNGQQRPEKFEGQPADVLYSQLGESEPEQAGEGLLSKLKNEEKMEVNSTV